MSSLPSAQEAKALDEADPAAGSRRFDGAAATRALRWRRLLAPAAHADELIALRSRINAGRAGFDGLA